MNDRIGLREGTPTKPGSNILRDRPQLTLLLLFCLCLPVLNPWIRGDGVGYYSFARAPLIEHSLDFTNDYLHANTSFRELRVDENGHVKPEFVTRTGHLDNHFTVGPAILWMPFLLIAHAGVFLARALGSSVAADGFSAPYRIAMALGTAVYGFLGLLIAFRLARRYVEERWALLATIGIWWASSLPVYMYFNPSWSHAHSAFSAALFFWYWHETRSDRTLKQWIMLGLIAGLMISVYHANTVLLAAPGVEAVSRYAAQFRGSRTDWARTLRLFGTHILFLSVILICMLPTFAARYIIYGNPFESGYVPLKQWLWRTPATLQVLFSADHGLFAWTPILILAFLGLVLFCWRVPRIGVPWMAAALAFFALISCYPDWDGLSSFGNRFFVSLTFLFVIGLAVLLDEAAIQLRRPRAAFVGASIALSLLVLWNIGFMYQWGTHLVPARGPISWPEMVHNQIYVVPRQMAGNLREYLFRRRAMMRDIEQRDVEQRKRLRQP